LNLDIKEVSKIMTDVKKFFNVHVVLDGNSTLPLIALYYQASDSIPNIIKKLSLQTTSIESYQIVQLSYASVQGYLKSIEK
jgi:hypothetical protein